MQFSKSVLHTKSPVINHCHKIHARLARYISPFFFFNLIEFALFIKYRGR